MKSSDLVVEVDMFDRLPSPFGLVRAGVAPDHQKYKTVTRVYDKNARLPNFRFYGLVEYGKHIHLQDLKRHYHQIVFTTGAQTDRNLGIPGEELIGSHSATDFVAWYNGHPDYVDYKFDLSQEKVAVIGLGNVAIDVARLLSKTAEELAATDMADYAIDAMSNSGVKEIYILGRRGPAQAAFTTPEIREMGELADADIVVSREDMTLDPHSLEQVEQSKDRTMLKNLELLRSYDGENAGQKSKIVKMRFLVSPVEIIGAEDGTVKALKVVKNKAVQAEDGSIRAVATDETEILDVGLVFRSVGYRGVPVPEIPFNDSWGTIANDKGRIVESDSNEPLAGLYTAGWIKRGPSGVIGTNKVDAQETVKCMLEDMAKGSLCEPESPEVEAAAELIRSRQPDYIDYQDWSVIDAEELTRGEQANRPRVKFTSVEAMLALLGR
jgi:ferredoxin--NADP+ reductase